MSYSTSAAMQVEPNSNQSNTPDTTTSIKSPQTLKSPSTTVSGPPVSANTTKFDIGSGELVPDIDATQMVPDVPVPTKSTSRDSANDCEDVVPDYNAPTMVPFEEKQQAASDAISSSAPKEEEQQQQEQPDTAEQSAPLPEEEPTTTQQSSESVAIANGSEQAIDSAVFDNADETDNNNVIETDNDNDMGNDNDNDNAPETNEGNNDNDLEDPRGPFMFKKKDVKPRTQSFQSVLSTASLKSLNQPTRHSSIVSTAPANNTKNFQSFIQAPVLSSVTNLKSEQIEIGRKLPFNHRNTEEKNEQQQPTSTATSNEDDTYDDQDTILQQQRLTLNALKKLTSSPLPKIDFAKTDAEVPPQKLDPQQSPNPLLQQQTQTQSQPELRPSRSHTNIKKPEPYQPAAVDLSTFASLTRQPHSNPRTLNNSMDSHSNGTLSSKKSGVSLSSTMEGAVQDEVPQSVASSASGQSNDSNFSTTQVYHNDMLQNQQTHLNNLNLKIQTQRSSLANDLNQRRRSQNASPLTYGNRVPSPSQNQYSQFSTQQNGQQQATGLGVSVSQGPHRQKSISSMSNRGNISQIPSQNQGPNAQTPNEQKMGQNQSYFKLQQLQSQSSKPQNQQQQQSLPHQQPQSLKQKHLQHIKGLRSPMYIPAVLRLTQDGDDKDPSTPMSTQNASSAASMRSFDSNVSTDSTNSPILSPSSSAKTFKSYEQFLRQPPTRKHWLKDETVYKCGISDCDKEFNFFERRHHCRKCGGIFCKEHTSHFLYINHLAQFTTGGRGTLSRVCSNCIQEYNEFMRTQFGLGSPEGLHPAATTTNVNTVDPGATSTATTKSNKYYSEFDFKNLTKQKSYKNFEQNFGEPANQGGVDQPNSPTPNEQVVGSVPANWTWSSF